MAQNCPFTSPVRVVGASYEVPAPSPGSTTNLTTKSSPAFYRTPTTKKQHFVFSPGAVAFSPESPAQFLCSPLSLSELGSERDEQIKRGRPPATAIQSLISQGSVALSSIRCRFCSRVFPREKSLQAHMRTHTGERPYVCDFPDCNKAFCQSGQLKTHLRLHTGEKPFVCSAQNCGTRFTHANRHCPDHPGQALVRDDANMPPPALDAYNATSPEAASWLRRYMMQQHEKLTPFKNHPPPHTKRSLYRDLEKQFLAARRISDTDDAGIAISQENKDPVTCGNQAKLCELSENGVNKAESVKTGQVSVIRKAPSSVQISDGSQPQKRSECLAEISDNDNQPTKDDLCASPNKLPRKQAEQEARYVSALALIQLAQGHS